MTERQENCGKGFAAEADNPLNDLVGMLRMVLPGSRVTTNLPPGIHVADLEEIFNGRGAPGQMNRILAGMHGSPMLASLREMGPSGDDAKEFEKFIPKAALKAIKDYHLLLETWELMRFGEDIGMRMPFLELDPEKDTFEFVVMGRIPVMIESLPTELAEAALMSLKVFASLKEIKKSLESIREEILLSPLDDQSDSLQGMFDRKLLENFSELLVAGLPLKIVKKDIAEEDGRAGFYFTIEGHRQDTAIPIELGAELLQLQQELEEVLEAQDSLMHRFQALTEESSTAMESSKVVIDEMVRLLRPMLTDKQELLMVAANPADESDVRIYVSEAFREATPNIPGEVKQRTVKNHFAGNQELEIKYQELLGIREAVISIEKTLSAI